MKQWLEEQQFMSYEESKGNMNGWVSKWAAALCDEGIGKLVHGMTNTFIKMVIM